MFSGPLQQDQNVSLLRSSSVGLNRRFYKHFVPNGTGRECLFDWPGALSKSKPCARLVGTTCGCGRRNRTFIFGFKARRVAGYTIPQSEQSKVASPMSKVCLTIVDFGP